MIEEANDSVINEIREDYKAQKKALSKYDTFIDNHQGLTVAAPLLLSLIGVCVLASVNSNKNLIADVIGILSLLFLAVGVVMAFVTAVRKSSRAKIEKKMRSIKQEALTYKKHAKEYNNLSRDELGLWRDTESSNGTRSHKTLGVSAIVIVLAVLVTPLLVAGFVNNNQSVKQQDDELQSNQSRCVDEANAGYSKSWKDTDTNGDGKLSYAEGYLGVTTNYYDSLIGCYQTNKTSDSESKINDIQQKRQQAVDEYTASQASRSTSKTMTSCFSNAVGSTVYTNCF